MLLFFLFVYLLSFQIIFDLIVIEYCCIFLLGLIVREIFKIKGILVSLCGFILGFVGSVRDFLVRFLLVICRSLRHQYQLTAVSPTPYTSSHPPKPPTYSSPTPQSSSNIPPLSPYTPQSSLNSSQYHPR